MERERTYGREVGGVENSVTPEQQAALVDLLIEHYDATRGVFGDTREEAQEVAAVVLAGALPVRC